MLISISDFMATRSDIKNLKKVEDDTARFSFNTAVSGFMIGVNDLTDLNCHAKELLEKFLVILTPYAPHICEELWHQIGNAGSVLDAAYPSVEEKYLIETSKEYPVAVNGKTRVVINLDLSATQEEVEAIVLKEPMIVKWMEVKQPKKIIFIKNKMINVVV